MVLKEEPIFSLLYIENLRLGGTEALKYIFFLNAEIILDSKSDTFFSDHMHYEMNGLLIRQKQSSPGSFGSLIQKALPKCL